MLLLLLSAFATGAAAVLFFFFLGEKSAARSQLHRQFNRFRRLDAAKGGFVSATIRLARSSRLGQICPGEINEACEFDTAYARVTRGSDSRAFRRFEGLEVISL